MTQAIEEQVDHGRAVQGQHLAEQQAANNGQAQRLAHFGAFGSAQQQRQGAEYCGQRGHQNGPETLQASAADRVFRTQTFSALQLQRQVDHQNGVLLDHANQQEQPEQRNEAELPAGQLNGQQGADSGRG